MVRRGIETTHLPLCRESGVSALSYSSLALGLLSGRVGPERTFDGDDLRRENPLFSQGNRERVAALMAAIAPVAEVHAATPAQVVIAWTLAQPGITFALCGARDPAQARENAAAGRLRLKPEDLTLISGAAATHIRNLDR
jgi:aryl-alcohol dehydrogenase-like predicted oxidoreductase